jgi:hypothetical protein
VHREPGDRVVGRGPHVEDAQRDLERAERHRDRRQREPQVDEQAATRSPGSAAVVGGPPLHGGMT